MPAAYADQHDRFMHRYRRTGVKKVIGMWLFALRCNWSLLSCAAAIGTTRNVIAQHSDGSTFKASLSLVETKESKRHTFTATVRPVKQDEDSFVSSISEVGGTDYSDGAYADIAWTCRLQFSSTSAVSSPR